jgi:delta 1-pyrroline-5-carboxylate dehydrogenase
MITSRSPQRPDDIVISVGDTTDDGVRAAAAKGRAAQREWAGGPAAARAAALDAAAAAVAAAAVDMTAQKERVVGNPAGEDPGDDHR